jgi:hypothetical protein
MSSSFRNSGRALLAFGAAFAGTSAYAAETFWQPSVEARVEGHSNRDLAPDSEDTMAGYFADLELLWGRNTGRSETRIRPRLRFQDYPDRDELQRLEQFLDVSTLYRTLRSETSVVGSYSRRDAYTAEIIEAGFDDFDPDDPSVSETSRLIVDNTRTRVQVRPTYTYRFSERSGITAGLTAETVDYESELPQTQVDFDYMQFETGWVQELDERARITFGPYVSRYDARDDSVTSDGYGLVGRWSRSWTERFRSTLTVRVERTESDRLLPVVVEESDTVWGATLNIDRRSETSIWRMNVGRTITPSGSGSKANSDEIRVGYERAMSPRLSSTAAVRALRVRSQSDFSRGDDRDYARAELGLRWAMTQTWSITGGYEFTWREFKRETDDANDNALFVSVKFEGLGAPSTAAVAR